MHMLRNTVGQAHPQGEYALILLLYSVIYPCFSFKQVEDGSNNRL